jgi:hypothetical protein
MNTGQTMLTILAIALLSVITMRYFQVLGQSGRNIVQSNTGLTATTIATSFLERAQNQPFDQNSDKLPRNQLLLNPNLFTSPDSLHLESGETRDIDSCDDFDDFHSFDSAHPLIYTPEKINETFHVEFNVYYVDTNNVNTNVPLNRRTFLKKMDICVHRLGLPANETDTVRLSTIFGYF